VAAQFGPITNIFIVPDQASINQYNSSYTGPCTPSSTNCNVGSGVPYTFNNTNSTTAMGRTTFAGERFVRIDTERRIAYIR